jgi:hypothetical protein
MSTKASTAALRRNCQRSFLRRRRVPRHSASGLTFEDLRHNFASFIPIAKETPMNAQAIITKEVPVEKIYRIFRRRLFAAILVGSLALAAPAIASAAPQQQQQREVRVPRIDRRAIENLQRWVSNGHDMWCKDAQLVASAEMRRIAPEFAGYEYDLASLPLETRSQAATRAVFTYTSLDGRKTYRITLRRYAWLLPLAGDTRSIVWVPTRTEIIANQ